MRKISLLKNKKRLTVIFTLLVFGIAVLLEGVFFTVKYLNSNVNDKKSFSYIVEKIEGKFISLDDFIKNDKNSKGGFKMGRGEHKNKEEFLNIIIIDNEGKKVVFNKIINDLKVGVIKQILLEEDYIKINIIDNYLTKKIYLNDNGKKYDILIIKSLKYSFSDYLTDLLGFIFITFIFSALFYYIGYRFVSKNLEPVELNMKDMQNFIHNAGHELKTPISIVHGNLQLIKATKTYDEDLIIEGINEVDRLNNLIESLIELSSINLSENLECINVYNEVKIIIDDFKKESKNKKIVIKVKKIDNVNLKIDKQYFYILFSNLLKNAIKYNNVGGKIDIIINKNKLIIKDTGIGISEKNIEKIFDRFFVVNDSRNNEGHGIGLSLVKKIINIYNWEIEVNSTKGEGTEFIIKF